MFTGKSSSLQIPQINSKRHTNMDALGAVPITEDTTGQCNCQIGMLITTKKKKYIEM